MGQMHSVHGTLKHLLVPIDTLLPHPDNPREHDEDVIRESLILNGQYGPVVVQRSTNRILAGNGTYAAAMSLGWTHLAAVFLDVDDEQALRVLLADNRINEAGGNDPEQLLALLKQLDGEFGGSGYVTTDFAEMLRLVEGNDLTLGSLGDLPEFEVATTASSLRSLSLTYSVEDFNAVVQHLFALRAGEEETFTDVVQRIVADALASR